MRKTIELVCKNCDIAFKRLLSEHKRNLKLNRRVYCSLSCLGKENVSHLHDDGGINREKALKRVRELVKLGLYQRDNFSSFKYFLRRCRKFDSETDISLDYLKEVWDNQKGKCAYTNIDMVPKFFEKASTIYSASLDRIDSSIGYIKGNVQFVCLGINYAKNNFSESEIKQFIQSIKNI